MHPIYESSSQTAKAWERFSHTGEINDYLRYKRLENQIPEVVSQYGGTAQNQWNHSPDSNHGG